MARQDDLPGTPELLLERWREDVSSLRKWSANPAPLELVIREVEAAFGDYLTWVPEEQAVRTSGMSARWLREQFPAWERRDQARRSAGMRFYRATILPQVADPEDLRAQQAAGQAEAQVAG